MNLTGMIPFVLASDAALETTVDASLDTVGERILYALERTGIGLLRVFLVLAILYGVAALMRVFMYDIPQKRKKDAKKETQRPSKIKRTKSAVSSCEKASEKPVAAVQPKTATVPKADVALPVVPAVPSDDLALVAAITAAVQCYLEAESGGSSLPTGFRVVSFRRRSGGSWNQG